MVDAESFGFEAAQAWVYIYIYLYAYIHIYVCIYIFLSWAGADAWFFVGDVIDKDGVPLACFTLVA